MHAPYQRKWYLQTTEGKPDVSKPYVSKVFNAGEERVFSPALNCRAGKIVCRGRGTRAILDIRGSLPPIAGDADCLHQVLWNLLSNAVKFTPAQGRIGVRAERVNAHVEITVRDTGVGIAPEFLPHVFERFRQANTGTTRDGGGLGLGLSIVRYLVEAHGGRVRAQSAGSGQGAAFTIELPVKAASTVN
jgi:signal transduction histidine kinase